MVPRTDLIDNVEETVVVHVVYRVVGAEDAQLLPHTVKHWTGDIIFLKIQRLYRDCLRG